MVDSLVALHWVIVVMAMSQACFRHTIARKWL